jgi:hypothetical protein
MRFMGLKGTPYFIGYFISDFIFYLVPNIMVIVFCNALSISVFTDY